MPTTIFAVKKQQLLSFTVYFGYVYMYRVQINLRSGLISLETIAVIISLWVENTLINESFRLRAVAQESGERATTTATTSRKTASLRGQEEVSLRWLPSQCNYFKATEYAIEQTPRIGSYCSSDLEASLISDPF